MLEESTQPLPDSYPQDTTSLVVDRVPNEEPKQSAEKQPVEVLKMGDRDAGVNAKDAPPTAARKDDQSDSTALTEVDEKVQSGRSVPIATANPTEKTARLHDEEAIEDPEHAEVVSPFSPMARVAARGRSMHHQMEDSVEGNGKTTNDDSKPANEKEVHATAASRPISENEPKESKITAPIASKESDEQCARDALLGHQSTSKRKSTSLSPSDELASPPLRAPPRSSRKEADEAITTPEARSVDKEAHLAAAYVPVPTSENEPAEKKLATPVASKESNEQRAPDALPSRQSTRKRKASNLSPSDQPVSRPRRASPRSSGKEPAHSSQGESQISINSIGSRKRQHKESQDICVVVTGVVLTTTERAKIKAIGGVILDKTEDAASATHVIATNGKEALRRTPKLMIALCKTSNIVSMKWLNDSAKKRKALATRNYLLLNDKVAERTYTFCMRETLRNGDRLRRENRTILDGRSIYVCKGVAGNKAPKEKELKLIIDAAGGQWVSSLLQLKNLEGHGDRNDGDSSAIIITSDPPSKGQLSNKDVARSIKNGATNCTTSWLFNCLLRQEIKDR
mmetsp:Transcript_826/g.1350  ORF Transcript_826/g.1350 Transcript_826/m.1350 type:complete len:569 (-) Transcript_826:425-2131(-)